MFAKMLKPLTMSFFMTFMCVCAATLLSNADYGPRQSGKKCSSAYTSPSNTQCSKHSSESNCGSISFTRYGGSCEDGDSDDTCRVKYNITGKNCDRDCEWRDGKCKNKGSASCDSEKYDSCGS